MTPSITEGERGESLENNEGNNSDDSKEEQESEVSSYLSDEQQEFYEELKYYNTSDTITLKDENGEEVEVELETYDSEYISHGLRFPKDARQTNNKDKRLTTGKEEFEEYELPEPFSEIKVRLIDNEPFNDSYEMRYVGHTRGDNPTSLPIKDPILEEKWDYYLEENGSEREYRYRKDFDRFSEVIELAFVVDFEEEHEYTKENIDELAKSFNTDAYYEANGLKNKPYHVYFEGTEDDYDIPLVEYTHDDIAGIYLPDMFEYVGEGLAEEEQIEERFMYQIEDKETYEYERYLYEGKEALEGVRLEMSVNEFSFNYLPSFTPSFSFFEIVDIDTNEKKNHVQNLETEDEGEKNRMLHFVYDDVFSAWDGQVREDRYTAFQRAIKDEEQPESGYMFLYELSEHKYLEVYFSFDYDRIDYDKMMLLMESMKWFDENKLRELHLSEEVQKNGEEEEEVVAEEETDDSNEEDEKLEPYELDVEEYQAKDRLTAKEVIQFYFYAIEQEDEELLLSVLGENKTNFFENEEELEGGDVSQGFNNMYEGAHNGHGIHDVKIHHRHEEPYHNEPEVVVTTREGYEIYHRVKLENEDDWKVDIIFYDIDDIWQE
ncbi:hypothetical protein [Alkalibacillus aidingensis]|uniref:hypothetical protein n=1 Tax=Alkalibacillus aidingensis TaxID=2747607 RepID=UPI0016608E04|nr:hypothetical protein [Alkalibacillus aidingensis]